MKKFHWFMYAILVLVLGFTFYLFKMSKQHQAQEPKVTIRAIHK